MTSEQHTSDQSAPLLLFIVGPPAVGKMTVGYEIARRTGLRLFHNHQTIELALQFFEFGTPAFGRINEEIRQMIFKEVAASDLPGMIFTFVWAFDRPEDAATVERYAAPFRARGSRILVVELQATQEERLRRNQTELRLAEKRSKRNLEWSRSHLLEVDRKYRLSSDGDLDGRNDYLRIDNTELSVEAAAERIIRAFGLERRF
jgi:hypothetical protein